MKKEERIEEMKRERAESVVITEDDINDAVFYDDIDIEDGVVDTLTDCRCPDDVYAVNDGISIHYRMKDGVLKKKTAVKDGDTWEAYPNRYAPAVALIYKNGRFVRTEPVSFEWDITEDETIMTPVSRVVWGGRTVGSPDYPQGEELDHYDMSGAVTVTVYSASMPF